MRCAPPGRHKRVERGAWRERCEECEFKLMLLLDIKQLNLHSLIDIVSDEV